ncbi:MAG: YlbF family regulator [Halolamina sp.]
MSVEADVDTDATASVEELGRELGRRIAETPEYERYAEAEAAVEADDEAQRRIEEFERLREEFTVARQTGQADQETVRKVKAAQAELHELPVMEEYLAAQEALETKLEAVNEAVSAPLSVDFGGEAGGCCHD